MLGPICEQGRLFLSSEGHRLSEVSGDVRETAFLVQRLSVIVQDFNRVLLASSFADNAI